ncbi:uncharacterized protein LOC131944507 [Physella acuta]|uniref:uncharacterized protein LOC131944507 n=1 Tax=Physella acuta TaxID=109671 RepID=UPI0027DBE371|nr:uncharacterized protein LOC131944507 [Physella acuta]
MLFLISFSLCLLLQQSHVTCSVDTQATDVSTSGNQTNNSSSSAQQEIEEFISYLNKLSSDVGSTETVNLSTTNPSTVTSQDTTTLQGLMDAIKKLNSSATGVTASSGVQETIYNTRTDPATEQKASALSAFYTESEQETERLPTPDPATMQDLMHFIEKLNQLSENSVASIPQPTPAPDNSIQQDMETFMNKLDALSHASHLASGSERTRAPQQATDTETTTISQLPLANATSSQLSSDEAKPTDSQVKLYWAGLDLQMLLFISITSAFLLLIIIVVVILACMRCQKKKKDLSLNKEFNRWDPQLLRPSQPSIDAFIFGSPIPTVAEMIKF